ncbi:hypothetical protein GN244_ATG17490 [Phytophthora infestans]|uniref:Uncharacterized protein n=1 Tax=Phytophthora infestans TaxID=4787 RepID=A0A833SNA2_PHYIN|nr:hypothetical protein GN244_ATG17490 [Phytophthora infestans]
MFDTELPEVDGWAIFHNNTNIVVFGETPRRVQTFSVLEPTQASDIAWIVLQLVEHWIAIDTTEEEWSHIRLYVQSSFDGRFVR